ncbi:hypothetical protein CLOM_g4340 [Closterium sp. NIES-68]|nr:hypothetical protein CLOM_g4340 [Closterium sp. NIES-68]GJP75971.1 hypothetical protein CLOP_g6369 [Closterium sp. NIES-67]
MPPRRIPLVVALNAATAKSNLVLLLILAAAVAGVHGFRGRGAESRKLLLSATGGSARTASAPAEGEAITVTADPTPLDASAEADAFMTHSPQDFSAEAVHAGAVAGGNAPALQLIIAEEGRAAGAVCLDGSAPGFYYRKGYGSGSRNWVLFFEGGAWCASPHGCHHRSTTNLGSSKHLLPAREMESEQAGMRGMLSPDPSINPDFHNWNAVFLPYCDGGSFSGDLEEPIHFNGVPLYLRGRRVADVLLKHLMDRLGLHTANRVLVAGTSAGAVAALLHCDRIRSTLEAVSPSISVRCLADSSMFLDVPDSHNKRQIPDFFRHVYSMHNLTASLPRACLKERSPEKHYECFMPEHLLDFIATPLFLINSNYDKVALRAIESPEVLDMGGTKHTDCLDHPEKCSKTKFKHLDAYRRAVATAVAPLHADSSPTNAVFLFSCFQHGSIHIDFPWKIRTAKGVPMHEAVGRWIHPGSHEKVHLIEGSYPCNSCHMEL